MGRATWSAIAIGTALVSCTNSDSPPNTSENRQAVTSCATLLPASDAFVRSSEMNKNFGQRRHLRAGNNDESVVRFDLSTIPPSGSIVSATVSLYVVDDDNKVAVNVHRVTAPWDEMSVTYKSFAQQFDRASLGGFMPTKDMTRVTVDVTGQVTRWYMHAQPNYGLLFED